MRPELFLWPLLPFLSAWLLPRGSWAGIVAGGVGLAGQQMIRPASWGSWAATLAAWAMAGAVTAFSQRREEKAQKEGEDRNRRLEDDVKALEKEHAALRHELDQFDREEASAFQVYSLAKSLTESLSWDGLVNRFSQVLQKVTGSTHFLLYLPSGATGSLELRLQSGAWHKDALPVASPGRHSQWFPAGRDKLLQVPLWQEEKLVGLLWVRWPDSSHPSVPDIENLMEHLIIGFQKAQLFARMEAMSRIDGLTGVLRRQPLMDQIEAEWQRASLFKTGFCFMLVDVDHFKKINDTFGHPGGDAVLARLGALLREGLYETDFVGRYGGEEFGVLLPRAEPAGVARKAERLRARVAAEKFSVGIQEINVTISIGLACYPRDGRTVGEIMAAADKALYRAKESGRNQVADYAAVR